jgi:Dyp-type peroxidase family
VPIDLTKPLAWKKASQDEQRLLGSLQGNILKNHGRPNTINIFFQIDPAQSLKMRAALRELANYHVTTAYQQLLDTEAFKKTKTPGRPFVAVYLSNTGYLALGVPAGDIPGDASFQGGMKAAALGDDAVSLWDAGFQGQIDGMILIGSENDTDLRRRRDTIASLLAEGGAAILKEQAGRALFNENGDGIEHFGYVDGRSQPLMLEEDVDREASDAGIAQWNPAVPLGVALVPEPNPRPGMEDISIGSYFVFRKLEQDVRAFKRQEQELADALALVGEGRERAGALVVGRFEDGTPVTMSDEARGVPPPNDFNYDADPGSRCPFHAHIRKTNPRGSGGFEPAAVEKRHLMPRRGIPYEDTPRLVHPTDIPESESLAEFDAKAAPLLPTDGVGLLFMAYNSVLADQFEFTQKSWANNNSFPAGGAPPKLDPIIGQGAAVSQPWPQVWDAVPLATTPFSFQGHVHMRGGEYFFAPSLTFLKAL